MGRSPREGHGYPLQYSGLENSIDRGAWKATVHGVTESGTQLSSFHFHIQYHCIKENRLSAWWQKINATISI